MQTDYAQELANFLDTVKRQLPENQREILLSGTNTPLSGTQGHVLMLLAEEGPLSNSELVGELEISPAAVTKAMHVLKAAAPAVVIQEHDAKDARIKRWALTEEGRKLAIQHEAAHRATNTEYAKILNQFSSSEQATISQFMKLMTQRLEK